LQRQVQSKDGASRPFFIESHLFMRLNLLHSLRLMAIAGMCAAVCSASAESETQRIYRCGNAYTNQPDPTANCKPMSGGSVTVIEGTRVQGPSVSTATANPNTNASAAAKVDSTEQRQRDAQAHMVLQAELQKAQKQYAELLRDWHNGEPERRADEHRQPQKYQDRVAQLRSALQRTEADIAGLQRELSRLPVTQSTGAKP
jgi:hypothetical protein